MIRYGAKALPEGGWLTLPECAVDGALIVGDAAGFLNSLRLKGIHLAMKTGMLAAETAFDAVVAGDTSEARLARLRREGPAELGRRRDEARAARAPGIQVRLVRRPGIRRAADADQGLVDTSGRFRANRAICACGASISLDIVIRSLR